MSSGLIDLDDLVTQVRNPTSKRHFGEAVACYNAGALRAAIVTAWTTCVYDIVEKIREIALAGDAEARQQEQIFEEISARDDITASLNFERGVLDLAKVKFELLSHQEHLDLLRLRNDRHRCAHPAMNAPQEPYQPTAELARYHLHSLASHLLIRPPVQGRAAVTRLFALVESEYFPDSIDGAVTVLRQGPLARAKASLIRNFALATLKALTNGTWSTFLAQSKRAAAAIGACLRLYPSELRQILRDDLPAVARAVLDANLVSLLWLAESFGEVASAIPDDVRVRLDQFVANPPETDKLPAALLALDVPYLRDAAERQVATFTKAEAKDAATRALHRVRKHPVVVDRFFELYMDSRSWDEANDLARRALIPVADLLTETQITHLLAEAATHPELSSANTTPSVLRAIRDNNPMGPERFCSLAIAAGVHDDFDDVVPVSALPEPEGEGPPGDPGPAA